MATREKWAGGYVRNGVFVIERWVGGDKFHASTRCRTLRAAMRQLEIFESHPAGYDPRGEVPEEGVVMTAELVAEHVKWQLGTKRNTPDHVTSCAKYLEAWLLAFDGADLRHLRTVDLKAHLRTWSGAKRYRVLAIKGFFRWLRQERGLIRHADDATLDLAMPAAKPENLRRRKALENSTVEAVIERLSGPTRDAVRLMASTGLHITEVRRFATGNGELFAPTVEQSAKGVISYLAVHHKSGRPHVVALMESDVLEAAENLRTAGWLTTRFQMNTLIAAGCRKAGVPKWTLGQIRHSVATWLHQAGVPIEQIAEMLGHRSSVTTRKFYVAMGHTARAIEVPRLRLVKG